MLRDNTVFLITITRQYLGMMRMLSVRTPKIGVCNFMWKTFYDAERMRMLYIDSCRH